MDENLADILRESSKIISKLQLLAVFFEDEIVYKIFLRSQVIHQLFEKNADLDIHKLELFHLQYTSTIVELLRKIKRSNEKAVSLIHDEIRINQELISSLKGSFLEDEKRKAAEVRQAQKLSISLRKVYQVLDEESDEHPFSNNIHSFSAKHAQAYFGNISASELQDLIRHDPNNTYNHPQVVIQRRLLGSLAKHDFNIEFVEGLKAGSLAVEIYHITGTGKHFVFYPSENLFLLCDMAEIDRMEGGGTATKKAAIVRSLTDKNIDMESRAGVLKTEIPEDVKTLLAEYYSKIGGADFLQAVTSFDVQANILRAMLNTDSL